MGRGVSLVENRGNSELLIEFYLTNCGSSSIPLHRGWRYPCWGGIPLFTTHHPLPSTENETVFLNKQLPTPMVSNVNTVFSHNSVFHGERRQLVYQPDRSTWKVPVHEQTHTIPTKVITSGILYAVGDCISQSIEKNSTRCFCWVNHRRTPLRFLEMRPHARICRFHPSNKQLWGFGCGLIGHFWFVCTRYLMTQVSASGPHPHSQCDSVCRGQNAH